MLSAHILGKLCLGRDGGHQFKTEMLCKSFKCSLFFFFIIEWALALLEAAAEDISGSRGSHKLSDDSDVERPGKESRYMKDESECDVCVCACCVRPTLNHNLADIPTSDRAKPVDIEIQCYTKLE